MLTSLLSMTPSCVKCVRALERGESEQLSAVNERDVTKNCE